MSERAERGGVEEKTSKKDEQPTKLKHYKFARRSFGLAAFESPNFPPLATLGVNTMFRKDIALPPPRAPFRAAMELAREIFVVALTPSFHYETLECVVKHSVGLKVS